MPTLVAIVCAYLLVDGKSKGTSLSDHPLGPRHS